MYSDNFDLSNFILILQKFIIKKTKISFSPLSRELSIQTEKPCILKYLQGCDAEDEGLEPSSPKGGGLYNRRYIIYVINLLFICLWTFKYNQSGHVLFIL